MRPRLLVLLSLSCSGATLDQLLDEAQRAWWAGKPEKAERLWLAAVSRDSLAHQAYQGLALASEARGDTPSAVGYDLLAGVAKCQRKRASLTHRLILASYYYSLGQTSRAESILTALVAENPNSPKTLRNLGIFYYNTGRYALGAKYLSRALHNGETNPRVRHILGLCFYHMGMLDSAVVHYLAALHDYPQAGERKKRAQLLNDLGAAFLAQGDTQRAMEAFDRALGLDAACAPAWRNKALLLLARGHRDEALFCLIKRVELTLDPNACLLAARLAWQGNKRPLLDSLVKKAEFLAPTRPETWALRYLATGNPRVPESAKPYIYEIRRRIMAKLGLLSP